MLFLTYLTVFALTGQAAAWGGLGHRTVGYLAQHFFTEDASQLIQDLLKPTESFDIGDAAVWPDTIRMRQPFTEGWHFIDAKDNPPESCNLDFERDCKPVQGCVISALSNQTSLLLNTSNPFRTRNEALKFILHFVGDIHQPLHTEDLARGGNDIPVAFDGHRTQRTNLHSVWDSSIARKLNGLGFDAHAVEEKPAAAKWAAQLAERVKLSSSPSSSASTDLGLSLADQCTDLADPNSCGIEWATEANSLVCAYVLAPGLDWVKENDLGRGEYYEGAAPVVELQVGRAGVRLAAWVNAIAAVLADSEAGAEAEALPAGEMGAGKDDL